MTQASSMTHATVTKLDNKLSESQGDQTEEMVNQLEVAQARLSI